MPVFINEDDYPQNYDWLSEEQQKTIVDYVNELDKDSTNLYLLWYRLDKTVGEKYKNFIEKTYRDSRKKLFDVIDAYEKIGIKLVYSWTGQLCRYSLATYDDAVAERAYYEDMAYDAEGDVDEYRVGYDYDEDINY